MPAARPADPFLRVPPFPGQRAHLLATARDEGGDEGPDPGRIVAALRRWRVGSTFWAAAAALPLGRDVILCASSGTRIAALVDRARELGLLDRAVVRGRSPDPAIPSIPVECDPWQAGEGATILADADDEWALVAALSARPLIVEGSGRYADLGVDSHLREAALERVVAAQLIQAWSWVDPCTGQKSSLPETIALLGHWRGLIEANRGTAAIFGVAKWKRVATDALLWDGTGPVRYAKASAATAAALPAGSLAVAWMARTDATLMDSLQTAGVRVGEIEDGMIRSNGLGANCVPPLSIVVDTKGPHFDPSRPSELEIILQTYEIDADLCRRAASLRESVVARGIGKYGHDAIVVGQPERSAQGKRTVLVTGQVEDDRSILCGGAGLDNLELLRRARALEPEAWIVFKPHPDVEAGHRKGHVPDARALQFADEIDRSSSISALLARVDGVHVITSLAGFEALLRGCAVTTHGVPFYAGWGLTRDMGPVPARRSRTRTLDELVAAALILYPRYLDPVTRLPCQPELLIERMTAGQATVRTPRILFREMLGRLRLLLRPR